MASQARDSNLLTPKRGVLSMLSFRASHDIGFFMSANLVRSICTCESAIRFGPRAMALWGVEHSCAIALCHIDKRIGHLS
jgi:hypothetical protein